MVSKINLLKILTSISFLLVVVSGEKISFFIGLYLFIAIFNPQLVEGWQYAYIMSACTLYLFISGNIKKSNKIDDALCIGTIIGMYIYIFRAINIEYMHKLDVIMLGIYALISFLTFGLILYRRLISFF